MVRGRFDLVRRHAGGEERYGQVFRHLPATNTLEFFYESEILKDLAGETLYSVELKPTE